MADACGDAMLWDNKGRPGGPPLPEFCSQFEPSTIDYWGSALHFVWKVHANFPQHDLLFTGHSVLTVNAIPVFFDLFFP